MAELWRIENLRTLTFHCWFILQHEDSHKSQISIVTKPCMTSP